MSTKTTEDQQKIFQQQFTQTVQILALLKQIGVVKPHEDKSEGPQNQVSEEQSTGAATPSTAETQQSQNLLNALAFIASGECGNHDSVAIMMEVDHDRSEVRFRLASSEKQLGTAMQRLDQVGQFLIKILSQGSNPATQDYIVGSSDKLLDEILQMKRADLSKDLGVTHAAQDGFLAELMKVAKSLTTSRGKPAFPPYSANLHPSPAEISKAGTYTVETHSVHMEFAWERLQKLIQLVRKTCNAGKGKKARTKINLPASKELILFVHSLHSHPALLFLLTQGRFNTSTIALKTLETLSLYQQSCINVVAGLLNLTGVKAVKFIEVPISESMQLDPTVTRQTALVILTQVLENAGSHIQEFRDFCKKMGYLEAQVIAGFTQSLQEKLLIHPEIALMHFYASSPASTLQPRMGCSSAPCYACYNLLKQNPTLQFEPLKTDGLVNSVWSLPPPGSFHNNDSNKIYDVMLPDFVIKLHQELRNTLESRFRPQGERILFTADLEKKMRDFVLNDVTAKFGTDFNESENSDHIQEEPAQTRGGVCIGCHDVTTGRRCSKCRKVFVCSMRCEASSEPWHISDCKPRRAIDSADHLLRFCYRDQIPDDDDVPGFGFDRCKGGEERSKLLGLYIGLVQSIEVMGITPVTSRQLHQWEQSNTLAENICKVYEEVRSRGGGSGYYDWFLKNKHIVDANTPKLSAVDADMNLEALAVWTPRAKGIRTINQLKAAFPNEAEYYVAVYYACSRVAVYPSPTTKLWMDFGFCTCHFEEPFHFEEGRLATVYKQLFEKCTFTEFCAAFKADCRDTIENLARRKGLGSELKNLENTGVYLKKPGPYTCFDLKQYIAIGNPTAEPIAGVAWDYGYYGCRNVKDKELWKTTFKKLFENKNHRDLDLHQACIKGKTFEYVSRILPDTPMAFQRLCANVYPLKEY